MNFLGDQPVKADAKGRIVLPSLFKKQMDEGSVTEFVIRKDTFLNCLLLYPKQEWDKHAAIVVENLDPFDPRQNHFKSVYFRNTFPIVLDAQSRMNLPVSLMDRMGFSRDMVMVGVGNTIQIWDKEGYEMSALPSEDFAANAQEFLRRKGKEGIIGNN